MKFDILINKHWDVFVNHICECYPLSNEFISKFQYELDWKLISKNEKLLWTPDFLEKYEHRIAWYHLAYNQSVPWSKNLIQKYKLRLAQSFDGPIDRLPFQRPRADHVKTEDWENLKQLLLAHDGTLGSDSKMLDDSSILANLDTIFERKFDYSQRFFFFGPIECDEYGLTPEFVPERGVLLKDFQRQNIGANINDNVKLVNGPLQEGKQRLFEVPRLEVFSYSPIMLLSERVKRIIEQFNLPDHKFNQVELKPDGIRPLNTFYLFQFDSNTLMKDIDFEKVQFVYRIKKGIVEETYSDWIKIDCPIRSYEELMEHIDNLRNANEEEDEFCTIEYLPTKFALKSSYDIYSMHEKVIVSNFLKRELERLPPNQMEFLSAQHFNIRMDQDLYDQLSHRTFDLIK